MDQSQVLGLFASPQRVEDAVRQEIRQQTPEYSSNINRRLFSNVAQAGAGFDPRVQRARQQQEVAKATTGEFGTSSYYLDMAEKFRQRGMLQSAIVAADKAKAIEKAAMDKAMAKYGSISFKDYDAKSPIIRRLIMQIERTSDEDARAELQRQLDIAMAEGGDLVAKRKAKTAAGEEEAKLEAQRYDEALTTVETQFNSANTQDETVFNIRERIIKNLDNINTGFGANAITGFQSFARTIGLIEGTDEWAQLSTNSEAAQAIIGQLMLNQIKTLGTNPSNADREFLMKTLPSITNQPESIRKIADYLEARAIFAREDARAKLAYLKNNKNLVGYETPKEIFDKLRKFYDDADVIPNMTPIPDEELIERPQVLQAVEERPANQPASAEEVANDAITQIDESPITEADYQNLQGGRAVVTNQPAPATDQSVIPPSLRTPAQSSTDIQKQIDQIQSLLSQDATDLDENDKRALIVKMRELREFQQEAQQVEAQGAEQAIEAMMLQRLGFGGEYKLQTMPRRQILESVKNMLIMDNAQNGDLSPAKLNLYRYVLQQLGER